MPLNPIDRNRAENPKDKAISTNPPQPTVKTEEMYRGSTLSGASLQDTPTSSETLGAISKGKNSDLYAQMQKGMSGFFQTHSIVVDKDGVSRVEASRTFDEVDLTEYLSESTQVRVQEEASKASEDVLKDVDQLHVDASLEVGKSDKKLDEDPKTHAFMSILDLAVKRAAPRIQWNALHECAFSKDYWSMSSIKQDLITTMIKKDSGILSEKNAEGETPVTLAIKQNKPELLQKYLEIGIDIFFLPHQTKEGSPLEVAIAQGNVKMVQIILRHLKVTLHYSSKDFLSTHNAFRTIERMLAYPKMVQLLLSYFPEALNRKNEEEKNALMLSIEKGYDQTISLLIRMGKDMDVNVMNLRPQVKDSTALIWAIRKGDSDLVDVLLKAGAKPDLHRKFYAQEETPLSLAASLGNTQIVRLLLSHGADVSMKNTQGKTPLECAKENNHSDILSILESSQFS